MKRILLALCTIVPLSAFADIIATYNNGNIEDVTVVSVGADEVVYKQGKAQKSIASSEVEGVLYDDGRFVSPPKAFQIQENTFQEQNLQAAEKEVFFHTNRTTTTSKEKSTSADEKKELKRRRQACAEEAMNVFNNSYTEFYNQALQQGLSKVKAKKQAFVEAYKAMLQFMEECSSGGTPESTQTNSNQSTPASDDGW